VIVHGSPYDAAAARRAASLRVWRGLFRSEIRLRWPASTAPPRCCSPPASPKRRGRASGAGRRAPECVRAGGLPPHPSFVDAGGHRVALANGFIGSELFGNPAALVLVVVAGALLTEQLSTKQAATAVAIAAMGYLATFLPSAWALAGTPPPRVLHVSESVRLATLAAVPRPPAPACATTAPGNRSSRFSSSWASSFRCRVRSPGCVQSAMPVPSPHASTPSRPTCASDAERPSRSTTRSSCRAASCTRNPITGSIAA
jgi:hypothetical protein